VPHPAVKPVSSDELADSAGEARERWSIPAIAVGLLRDGATVTAGVGAAPDDVFRIASITKPFVATLAHELVDLDAPPPGSRVAATVRQLLSHQGGLACEWPGSLEEFGDGDEALQRVAAGEPRLLPFGPGELFSYSNVGFWLVGAAIAQASGTTFEEAMQTRLLDSLPVGSTGFEARTPVPGYVQVAPGADEHRRFDGAYPRVRRPSGGLLASVGDLLRFAESQFERRDLQRPLISGPGFEHGLGWFLRKRGGRRSVEHPGSAAGYQSLLVLIPEERVAFAALTNSSRGLAAIIDVLERLGLATDTPEEVQMTRDQLGEFVGRYEAPGVRLELSPDDDRLRLDYSEKDPFRREWDVYPPYRLRPVGEREFELVDGEWRGQWLGFPREGVVSFGIAAQRVR
jgi:CubicO group peptidase (beta-lactamase class C family)